MRRADAEARISAVEPADVPALIALARETWYLHYPGIITVAQIEYMLAQRYAENVVCAQLAEATAAWYKLQCRGQLAGFASCERASDRQAVKLDKLYVHPRFQRRGFGAALLAHVERDWAQRGCRRLFLQVNKHNASSLAMYRRSGYRVASAATCDIGRGFVMDDYIMEKHIGRPGRDDVAAGPEERIA
jgi:diamine N-acetyltransferase